MYLSYFVLFALLFLRNYILGAKKGRGPKAANGKRVKAA